MRTKMPFHLVLFLERNMRGKILMKPPTGSVLYDNVVAEPISSEDEMDVSFFNHAKAIQQECDWENEERAIPMQTAFPSTLAISKRMVRKSAKTLIKANAARNFKKPSTQRRQNSIKTKTYATTSERKIDYAVGLYMQWREKRLVQKPEAYIERCDILTGIGKFGRHDLCDSLCLFIDEVVRVDDKEFPPNTIKGLIYNIQMHLRKKRIPWKLFDPVHFMDLHNSVDNIMKECTAQGLAKKRQAEIISFAVEELLWEKGVLGEENSLQLLQTILFVIGLSCALHSGKEHWSLRRPGFDTQFEIIQDESGSEVLCYREDALQKSNQGGLNDNNQGCGKVVYIYPSPNVKRDPVRLYKKYVSLLPTSISCKVFYLRPLRKPTAKCWFRDQPYGQKNVSQIVKKIFEQAKISGNYTNHSLRRTAATRMLEARVEEKVVKEITGHKSDCVRMYQRTSDDLKKDACLSIYGFNPRRVVTCEVTKPKIPKQIEASGGETVNDDAICIPESQITPLPTPTVRCISNHRGSSDMVHICDLLKHKVEANSKVLNMTNVSTQVEFPCQCTNKTIETKEISTQTESTSTQGRRVSFDISLNWSM